MVPFLNILPAKWYQVTLERVNLILSFLSFWKIKVKPGNQRTDLWVFPTLTNLFENP